MASISQSTVSSSGRRADEFSHAKVRIIRTAERLFADRGIEAVSLREIALQAGHGNNNAVQYHFGSKDGLVQAIFAHRVSEMDVMRKPLLEKAKAQGLCADMRTLLEILCLPIRDLVDEQGKHTYAAFMNQYLTRYRPKGVRHIADEVSDRSSELRNLLTLIEQRLAYIPHHLADSRTSLCYLMFTSMLVRSDHDGTAANDIQKFQERIADTLEIMVIAICAPYRALSEDQRRAI